MEIILFSGKLIATDTIKRNKTKNDTRSIQIDIECKTAFSIYHIGNNITLRISGIINFILTNYVSFTRNKIRYRLNLSRTDSKNRLYIVIDITTSTINSIEETLHSYRLSNIYRRNFITNDRRSDITNGQRLSTSRVEIITILQRTAISEQVTEEVNSIISKR